MNGLHRYEFTDMDFRVISELMSNRAGIHLPASKRELVYGRLAKRVRMLGLESFSQYCALLQSGDNAEIIICMNALTTNVTSFFREGHHFQYLAEKVLPDLSSLHQHSTRPRIRIWSAGCSSGEEPYSIAIVIRESMPSAARWDIKILATDIDTDILAKARTGVYPLKQVENMSDDRRKRWFRKGTGSHERQVRIVPEIRDMVYFKQLNLTHNQWPMTGPFDVIFCRNVVIYFEKETRKTLLHRFADLLTENGHLFMGHSESLFGLSRRFESTGKTSYRKVA